MQVLYCLVIGFLIYRAEKGAIIDEGSDDIFNVLFDVSKIHITFCLVLKLGEYTHFFSINEFVGHFGRFAALRLLESPTDLCDRESNGLFEEAADKGGNVGDFDDLNALRRTIQRGEG